MIIALVGGVAVLHPLLGHTCARRHADRARPTATAARSSRAERLSSAADGDYRRVIWASSGTSRIFTALTNTGEYPDWAVWLSSTQMAGYTGGSGWRLYNSGSAAGTTMGPLTRATDGLDVVQSKVEAAIAQTRGAAPALAISCFDTHRRPMAFMGSKTIRYNWRAPASGAFAAALRARDTGLLVLAGGKWSGEESQAMECFADRPAQRLVNDTPYSGDTATLCSYAGPDKLADIVASVFASDEPAWALLGKSGRRLMVRRRLRASVPGWLYCDAFSVSPRGDRVAAVLVTRWHPGVVAGRLERLRSVWLLYPGPNRARMLYAEDDSVSRKQLDADKPMSPAPPDWTPDGRAIAFSSYPAVWMSKLDQPPGQLRARVLAVP